MTLARKAPADRIAYIIMHWVASALCIVGFSVPSGLLGAPSAIGAMGTVLGPVVVVFMTVCSARGALMLVELLGAFPECETFGDLGGAVLGPKGAMATQAVQQGNFLLFLPVALLTCASGAQGLLDPERTGAFGNCNDYWILSVALLCLAFTQFRRLDALENFSFVSLAAVAAVAALAVAIVLPADLRGPPGSGDGAWDRASEVDDDHGLVAALMFGNPDMRSSDYDTRVKGWGTFALGLSLAAWGYVPSFLTVELLYAARHKRGGPKRTVRADFPKAVWLSAVLNVLVVCGVGEAVVWAWGWDVADPLTLGPNGDPGRWHASSAAARSLNAAWLVSSFLSYALDSIPLGHAAVRRFGPGALPPSSLIVGRSGAANKSSGSHVINVASVKVMLTWVGDRAASIIGAEPLWGREAGLDRFGGDDNRLSEDDGHISDPFETTLRPSGKGAGSDKASPANGGGGLSGGGASNLRGIYGSGVGYHGASVARPVDWKRFLVLTVPPWLLALAMALLVPSLSCMIAVATALTVPAASLLLPACLYYNWVAKHSLQPLSTVGVYRGGNSDLEQPLQTPFLPPTPQRCLTGDDASAGHCTPDVDAGGSLDAENADAPQTCRPGTSASLLPQRRGAGPFTRWRALDMALVTTAGALALVVCVLAAVAKIGVSDLRGPLRIGCKGWLILARG